MKPEILLKAYILHQSDDAFRELVAVSINKVYSTAFRIVDGPEHLVEETVLRVFWELARKAPRMGEDVVIAAWLHECTCKTAVRVLCEQGRPANRLALKSERKSSSTSQSMQTAPAGLATRVSQGVLLNVGRNKSFAHMLWPAWMRLTHVGAVAVCVLVLVVFWNVPFRKSHPIVRSEGVQMMPASFAQLGGPDGDVLVWSSLAPNPNSETKPNRP